MKYSRIGTYIQTYMHTCIMHARIHSCSSLFCPASLTDTQKEEKTDIQLKHGNWISGSFEQFSSSLCDFAVVYLDIEYCWATFIEFGSKLFSIHACRCKVVAHQSGFCMQIWVFCVHLSQFVTDNSTFFAHHYATDAGEEHAASQHGDLLYWPVILRKGLSQRSTNR